MADKNDNTGRNVLLAAGGAGLLWLLLRRGGGLGVGGSGAGDAAKEERVIKIRVDSNGVSIDGRPVDVAGAVEAAKLAGRSDLVITGAARTGTVDDLLAALDAAGVKYAAKGGGHA